MHSPDRWKEGGDGGSVGDIPDGISVFKSTVLKDPIEELGQPL